MKAANPSGMALPGDAGAATSDSVPPVRKGTFEEALLRGETGGYAVCVKPLRFAKLPDVVATSFIEVGEDNCYYVFETKAGAQAQLDRVPPGERLGCEHTIREVRCLPGATSRDGPQFDATGHPFEMRGFIVDQTGNVKEWRHAARLGWREGTATTDAGERDPLTLWEKLRGRLRRRTQDPATGKTAD